MLLALLGLAVVVSIVVQHVVYPALSWNRDEATYLWQIRALDAGQLLTTTGGLPRFFQPWLTGVTGGQFFSQYTLGWPGVMFISDQLFGSPISSMWWGTVLAVLGTYLFVREITRNHVLSLVSAALLLTCPMIITQSGVYLGYLFSLGMGLLFGTALLAGLRRASVWLQILAGLALGLLFITRPFDAVLWAVAMGGYAVYTTWREWGRQARAAVWVFLGFLPFVVLTLVHNHTVTGSFTQFPFTAKEPLDKFGFGYRRLMPGVIGIDYTVGQAMRGSGVNASYVPQFLIGSYLGLVVAFVGFWMRRRDRSTWVLLAMMVVFPVGYFFFWGNRLASGFAFLSGPVYFIPLFVPLSVFIAAALIALWRRRPGLLVALVVVLVLATLPFLYDKSAMNHRLSAAQEPWRASSANVPANSLVFVRDSGPFLLHLNPYSLNAPDLDGPVLWSVDRGAAMFTLLDRYPDRRPYIQRTNYPLLDNSVKHPDAKVPTISLLPITVVSGPVVTLHVTARNPDHDPAVVVTLEIGDRVEQRTLEPTSPGATTYETTWRLAPSSTSATGDTVPVSGRGLLSVSASTGASAVQAMQNRQLREQFAYRLHEGEVQVAKPPRKTVVIPESGRIVLHDVGGLTKLRVRVDG
jgi:4-amino-4-deoxy-L-arabinose transferase-like glycosyltransferase